MPEAGGPQGTGAQRIKEWVETLLLTPEEVEEFIAWWRETHGEPE